MSKEGAAKKAMIRIAYVDRSEKVTFDFATRFSDRDAVRDVLNNLQQRASQPQPQASTPQGQNHSNDGFNGAAALATEQPPKAPVVKPVSREEGLRRARIMARKEVQKLHKTLVGGHVVSDDEFWSAMRWRYKDNGEPRGRGGIELGDDDDENDELKMTGVCGVPSEAFEPNASDDVSANVSLNSNGAGSERKLGWASNIPTAAERHLVFMEKPAVGRAYRAKVLNNGAMTEAQFWNLFVSSSLAGRRVGRMTKSDTTRTAEADAMFAPFEVEEKKMAPMEVAERARHLDRDLDLDRADDHRGIHVSDMQRKRGGDGTSAADESSGLRLMRMVNRHGDLLLKEGGIGGWVGDSVAKVRPLEDLQEEAETEFSSIGVQNRTGVVDAQRVADAVLPNVTDGMAGRIRQWDPDVSRFRHPIPGSQGRLIELLNCMKP